MSLPFFPLERAYLAGCWLESALWGLFTLLFASAIYLTSKRRSKDLYRVPIVVMILMYILSTITAFISFARLFRALTSTDGLGILNDNLGSYLWGTADALYRAQEIIYCLNLGLIDTMVTWRCWKLCSSIPWLAMWPVISLVGTLVSLVGLIVHYSLRTLTAMEGSKWVDYAFGFSLATIVMAKVMITVRILYMWRRGISPHVDLSGSRYRKILIMVAESGGIVFFQQIIEFTLRRLDSTNSRSFNAYIVLHLMAPQLMGIAHALKIASVASRDITGLPSPDTEINTNPAFTFANSTQDTFGYRATFHLGINSKGSGEKLELKEQVGNTTKGSIREQARDGLNHDDSSTTVAEKCSTEIRSLSESLG